MESTNYQSLGMHAVLEKEKQRKKRSRLLVIISVGVLLILIAVGVTVGVILSKNNSKEKSTTSSPATGGTGGSTGGTGGTTGSNSGDPSDFAKDSRLHRSFYGLAYTPDGSLPDFGCSISLASVIEDVQVMSQMTKRIRLYGSDCNQTAMVLEAVKQTKVDMQVFVGNYVVAGDDSAYLRQRDAIKSAIETYGADHIAGVTVGNEFMLNWVTEHQTLDANSAIANEGAAILTADIADTRQMLAGMGVSIPVGNSDAGSFFNDQVMSAIDYGMSNVHAWFANTTAAGASAWVNQFFQENNVAPAALLPNNPKMYIAETGWPTGSDDASNSQNGPSGSPASVESLQTFIDTFVCQANTNNVPYFFFEFKDEEWKSIKYGGVEGHWGLFDKDKVMKGVTIPDCESP